MKLFLTTLLFLMVFRHADAKVCPGSTPARSDDGPYSSYTVPNLIAHSIERIVDDQGSVTEILLLNPKIFGLDAENAILTASLHVIVDDVFDIPQIYSFALRTDDCGENWIQVFDPIDQMMPPITDVRFIGSRGLLLYEHSRAGNRFGFLYSQDWGRNWIDSELEGISGSAHLVDWSVRSPHEGVAVVASDSGIPIDGDASRETAYWLIRTPNGFQWTIDEVVERGYEQGFVASDYLYPSEWDQSSELWQILEADDVLSVTNSRIVVLQLTMNSIWSAAPSDR